MCSVTATAHFWAVSKVVTGYPAMNCFLSESEEARILRRLRDCTLCLELERLGDENRPKKDKSTECGSAKSRKRFATRKEIEIVPAIPDVAEPLEGVSVTEEVERVSVTEEVAHFPKIESHFGTEVEISQVLEEPYEDSSVATEDMDDEEENGNEDEKEEEEDHFLFCEECKKYIKGDCSVHGALVPLDETRGRDKASARHTTVFVPKQLTVRRSTIPEAGLGVFAKEVIPKRVCCGPYKGVMLPVEDVTVEMNTSYMWELKKKGCVAFVIDGQDETKSNWMRFVNCARTESEQNMVSFQYKGGMFYRLFRTIRPGEELLVWYGDQYAEELGIDVSTGSSSGPGPAGSEINAVSVPSSEPDNRDGQEPRNAELEPRNAELKPRNAELKPRIAEREPSCVGLELRNAELEPRNVGLDLTNSIGNIGELNGLDFSSIFNPGELDQTFTGLDLRKAQLILRNAALDFINGPCPFEPDSSKTGLDTRNDRLDFWKSLHNLVEPDSSNTGLDTKSDRLDVTNGIHNLVEPDSGNTGLDTRNDRLDVTNGIHNLVEPDSSNPGLDRGNGESSCHSGKPDLRIGRGVRYKCLGCCSSFVENNSFQLHLNNQKDCAKANPPVFACKHCDARFTRLYSLQIHYFQHLDQRVAADNPSEPYAKRKKSSSLEFVDNKLSWFAGVSATVSIQTLQQGAQLFPLPAQGQSSGHSSTQGNMAAQHPPTTLTDSPLFLRLIEFIASATGVVKVDGQVFHLCPFCGKCFATTGGLQLHLKSHFNGSMPGEPKSWESALKSGRSGPIALPEPLQQNATSRVDLGIVDHAMVKKELDVPPKRCRTHVKKAALPSNRMYCQLCSKAFYYQGALTNHMKKCHSDRKMPTCSFCGKTFIKKHALELHERTHSNGKQFLCLICHKTFKNTHNHNRHMKTHQEDKPFQCSECDKQFATEAYLKNHIQTMHTLAKSYECSVCHKAFSFKGSLRVHMRLHDVAKTHQCDICSQSFRQKSHLTAHVRRHTNDKPFVCKICNFAYTYSYTLKRHLEEHVDVES